MKLMIADDDDIIRKQLLDKIPWEQHGFELVGAAANGQEAYDIAIRNCPQIVLTDIQMPYMDGIELARRLAVALEQCRVILLTGYDDFAYAKEAISLGIADYILKGESDEAILAAVKRTSEEIKKHQTIVRLSAFGKQLQKEKLLSSILNTEYESPMIKEDSKLLGIDFSLYSYRVAIVQEQTVNAVAIHERPSKQLRREQDLYDCCCSYVREKDPKELCFIYQNYVVIIFEEIGIEATDKEQEDTKQYFITMTEHIKKSMGMSVVIGVGKQCVDAEQLSYSFDEAIFAVSMPLADDVHGNIVFYKDFSQTKLIRTIRDYIHHNYANPKLSLNEISEKLFFSPTYISAIFKRFSDKNFKAYLIDVRMKKACELLMNEELCSYEIAEMVGYPNSQYFSVMFKKYSGMSPIEYRESLTRKNNK